MCLWLLTACLGMIPTSPTQNTVVVVQQGVPTPIIQPTTTRPTVPATTAPATIPVPPPVTVPPATAPPATAGLELLNLVLCDDPDVVCLSNLDANDTGPLLIDPRLGTTPPTSGNLQLPNYDMAVRFPRYKRSSGNNSESGIKDFIMKMSDMKETEHRIHKRQTPCTCVQAGTCANGAVNIDIRIVTPGGSHCPTGQVYCCSGTNQGVGCGVLQTVPATTVFPGAGQASYGEYPWQALILTLQNDYIAGGVLIDQLNVLTVTHRIAPYASSGTTSNIKVRLGEWDAAGTYEPLPFQEYPVIRVFSHPSFNRNTLQYDLTVLRLSSPVPFAPNAGSLPTINRACLPPTTTSTYTGQRCWVSGWGKDMFGVQGQYQQILKEVDVTMVAPATCQSQLQTARLGPTYALDTTSFVCAGGEPNKDSCTGDGGSGLVCLVNGQWVVVGLVSWGLGCATANVPGVYVNVAGLLTFIQQVQATTT